MSRRIFLYIALALITLLAMACVQKPRMQYSKDQLAKLSNTKELMRVNYHELAPVWESAKRQSFSPADFKTMATAAARVEVASVSLTSKEVTRWFKEGFVGHAATLGKHARALGEAAEAGKEAEARKAIKGINRACEDCHKDFK